jgi:type VI secretion system protein ImpF
MRGRINPTIFDKLAASQNVPAGRTDTPAPHLEPDGKDFTVVHAVGGYSRGVLDVNLDSFTERALRANVRRELGWLLNTTNLESACDLTRYPRVATSVLNYGVADLSGKAQSHHTIIARVAQIRSAILAFEPRLAPQNLSVEAKATIERENSITYSITGDISSAAGSMQVQFFSDVESDTGNVEVRG